jgi:glycosyltransferase involved in cell wall biosynthesis
MNYVVPPTKLPRVVTVYDCWALLNPAQCSSITNDAMKALRRAIQTGAVVHASSHATATTLRELFPTVRIEMIYLGAPEHRLTSSRTTRPDALSDMGDAPFIVAIGTAEKRKNYPRLVEAFALAAHENSDLQLVIAGSAGDDSALLQQAIDSLSPKLAERVHLIGRVTDENIAWLYQQATAMAYPSLDEGFGFPLLEAMSANLPIVGSKRGSIPEVSGTAAILVDPLDVPALAEALINVATNSELRIKLQAAGATQLQSFSWEKTAQQLVNLYNDLVK